VQQKSQLLTASQLFEHLEERAERITEYFTDLLEKVNSTDFLDIKTKVTERYNDTVV
jgi:hypothetical protein